MQHILREFPYNLYHCASNGLLSGLIIALEKPAPHSEIER